MDRTLERMKAEQASLEAKWLAEAPDREKIYDWVNRIRAVACNPPEIAGEMGDLVQEAKTRIVRLTERVEEEIYVEGD